ncbi:MAG: hypothetical protein ABI840_00730 [bacterium]
MNWFAVSNRFKEFCYINRDKIRSKIRNAKTNEYLEDVIFELEVAYLLLLDRRFEVEYERGGIGENRAPDFFVTWEKSISFNVEARRIREPELSTRFDNCLQKIENEVRKIPSDLCIKISLIRIISDPLLVGRFESSKEKLIDFIKKNIEIQKNELSYDSSFECPLEDFEYEYILEFTRPSNKDDKIYTTWYTPSKPIFYTQKEYYKLGDIICEKLGQMQPNMLNLLIIGSTSTTHEKGDLIQAINSLLDSDEEFFIKKGFPGKKAFLEKMKYLSGIVSRDNFIKVGKVEDRNLLWLNDQASQRLPDEIVTYLLNMDKPKNN